MNVTVSPTRRSAAIDNSRRFTPEVQKAIQRRVEAGETVSSIAREMGLSRQRIHQVINRSNPTGKVITMRCRECKKSWKTMSLDLPERCGVCGTYDWKPEPKA